MSSMLTRGRAAVAGVVGVVLVAGGCASTPRADEAPAVARATVFDGVPSDTAWIYAVDGLTRETFAGAAGPFRDGVRDVLSGLRAIVAGVVTDGVVPASAARLEAMIAALPVVAELLDDAELEALGVRFPMQIAVYGAPVWPVARVALADPGRAAETLARRLGAVPRVRAARGEDGIGWEIGLENTSVVVAVAGDALVVALGQPAGVDVLEQALRVPTGDGAAVRERMRAVASRLARAAPGGGAAPRLDLGVGWLESSALGMWAAGFSAALAAESASQGEGGGPGPDPGGLLRSVVCGQEWVALARTLPRVVFGCTESGAAGTTGALVIDGLDDEVARALGQLGEGGVALGREPYEAPVLALSVAMDLGRLGDLLGLFARRMAAQEYACAEVRAVGDALASGAMQLGLTGRLVFGGLHGVYVRIGAWGEDDGAGGKLLGADAVVAVAHERPGQLLGLLRQFLEVAVELPDDGTVVELRAAPRAVAARQGAMVVAASGGGAEAQVAAVLEGGTRQGAPLVALEGKADRGRGDFGLVALVDGALAATGPFVDGARVEGVVARVGDRALTAAELYAAAAARDEVEGADAGPGGQELVAYVVDRFVAAELVAEALRGLRDPGVEAGRAAGLGAEQLVEDRLERLGRLKFTAAQRKARGRRLADELGADGPTGSEAVAQLDAAAVGWLRHEAVAAEVARLVLLQRKKTVVVDDRAAAQERGAAHWQGVFAVRDAIAARAAALTGGDTREALELRVVEGRVEVVVRSRAAGRAGVVAAP